MMLMTYTTSGKQLKIKIMEETNEQVMNYLSYNVLDNCIARVSTF